MEMTAPRRRGRPRKNPDDTTAQDATIQGAPAPSRPPIRPNMREEDPRAAAELRAQEIMGNIQQINGTQDEFFFDPNSVPDGWTYEWKRRLLLNQEDPSYATQLEQVGWQPVPASRHPYMMPLGGKYITIERKGMILMERPQVITDRFIETDRQRARDQVRVKEQQLSAAPDGQFTRDHNQVRPKINKGYEPMPIPTDK